MTLLLPRFNKIHDTHPQSGGRKSLVLNNPECKHIQTRGARGSKVSVLLPPFSFPLPRPLPFSPGCRSAMVTSKGFPPSCGFSCIACQENPALPAFLTNASDECFPRTPPVIFVGKPTEPCAPRLAAHARQDNTLNAQWFSQAHKGKTYQLKYRKNRCCKFLLKRRQASTGAHTECKRIAFEF